MLLVSLEELEKINYIGELQVGHNYLLNTSPENISAHEVQKLIAKLKDMGINVLVVLTKEPIVLYEVNT